MSYFDFITLLTLRLTNRALKTAIEGHADMLAGQRKFRIKLYCEENQSLASQPRLIVYEHSENAHGFCVVRGIQEVFNMALNLLYPDYLQLALQPVRDMMGAIGNSVVTQVSIDNTVSFGTWHGTLQLMP